MKNSNTLVAALAGVLAGTVIGAGTYYSAQIVSYRYGDVEHSDTQHRASDNRPSAVTRTVDPRHRAAGVNAETDSCNHLSGQRKTRCIGASRDGIDYQESEIQ